MLFLSDAEDYAIELLDCHCERMRSSPKRLFGIGFLLIDCHWREGWNMRTSISIKNVIRLFACVVIIAFLCITCSHAKTITYNEPLPGVHRGSWKYKCTVKIDFEKRLLNMAGCTILDSASRIVLFDKEWNFIGSYYPEIDYLGNTSIKGGFRYHSMVLDFSSVDWSNAVGVRGNFSRLEFNTVGMKDVRYARLENAHWDLNEDDDIICKDKRAVVQYIGDDDYEYECVVAYNCPKGLYAVDEVECDKLPKNAIRLPKEGFKCKKGFELYENPDTTYCYKPYQCPKGSYAVSKNECGLLPKNARRSVEDGYECFKGYVKNGEECIEKSHCEQNELYQESDNRCYELPEHAQWDVYASNESDFVCDEGFVKLVSERECRKTLTSCAPDSIISRNLYSCEQIPYFADKMNEYLWRCKEGYKEVKGNCYKVVTECDGNSVVSDDSFSCNPIPDNAYKVDEFQWACLDGFFETDGSCLKNTSCYGKYEYPISAFECGFVPDNAHRVGNYWECDVGFRNVGDRCIFDNCEKEQVIDTIANECIDVPKHAHKLGDYAFDCNHGYYKYGQECRRSSVFKSYGPLVLFRLQFEGFFGGSFYEKEILYSKNDVKDNIAGLGIGILFETSYNDVFTFGLTNSIRMYTLDYDLSLVNNDFSDYLFRDDISVSLLFGGEHVKFLLRPIVSIQLFENVSMDNPETKYELNNVNWALELGVRYKSNHEFFIALSQPLVKKVSFLKEINRVFWLGYRYNFTINSTRMRLP